MTRLLSIEDLSIAFSGRAAVTDFNLDIHASETVALVGESGCGKSTTALSILRLLPASARLQGAIRFDGEDLLALPEPALRKIRGNRIGMIFQEPMTSLNPVLSIGFQIGEALRLHEGLSRRAALARAEELLDLVRIPEPHRRLHDHPHQLSGGQRQRVMIAAAIACRPRLLIADEPTTALDVTIQAQILELLGTLRKELSMSLLLITHDLGVVAQWADRVAVMYQGRKVEEADTHALFERPAHPYSRGLLGSALHLDDGRHYHDYRLPEIAAMAGGGPGEARFELTSTQPRILVQEQRHEQHLQAGPLLSVQDLRVSYPGADGPVEAVKGVSLQVARGESVGLVGESGCGKSTLSKAIMRLIDNDAGSIVLGGQHYEKTPRRALGDYRRRVQMIFQDPYGSLNPRQNVETLLETALAIHKIGNAAERRARIRKIVDAVGLPSDALRRYPNEFSGGQRQRIGIARALVLQPELIICDEPVSALDVSIQAQILNLLVDLKQEFGLSYLFISHDLSVVHYFSDRVLVMYGGRIVEEGDHESIWRAPAHAYTRQLIDAVPLARPPQAAELLPIAVGA
ncbi:ABC transporter ATP-binding protein [Corticibacter populi]|uniref:ABC transporter ATP-binding protein n=1 Tax=Corticibacter populi TaxID=1550736 RepID=A0A3M6QP84_9BURK|nr:ABC transporter ATP-binding protein [Corticibacter populi]RMX04883.1 ABC transporter ATP-binding protein [Corticibacter populi]RZS33693.1 peptide/nickel transport system ATP-binding protein [Corticibacter populi]